MICLSCGNATYLILLLRKLQMYRPCWLRLATMMTSRYRHRQHVRSWCCHCYYCCDCHCCCHCCCCCCCCCCCSCCCCCCCCCCSCCSCCCPAGATATTTTLAATAVALLVVACCYGRPCHLKKAPAALAYKVTVIIRMVAIAWAVLVA